MDYRQLIRLYLLGPFTITTTNSATTLRRKTRALLAYLAATGQSHSRQHLMALFCAEAKNPSAVLRSLLSRLRRNLNTDILLVDGELVRLNPAICWVDCLHFQEVASSIPSLESDKQIAQITTTLDLYRGPFLADMSLHNAPEFELWLLGERARYHSLAERSLSSAVSYFTDNAAWDKAIHYAQRLVTENPLLEEAHGRLIWLYARTGQLEAAHAQYKQISDLLATELAVEPAAELQRLYADIQAGQVRPQIMEAQFTLPTHETAELSPLAKTTLIGRDMELGHLQQAWQQAQTGKGQVILIEAEAGGGKSYLMQTFGRQLPSTRFLYGDGYESTQSVPYTAWLELLELALSHYSTTRLLDLPKEVRTAIAQLIPEKRTLSDAPPLPTERLFTALASFLLQDQPRFLFIDNLQWADSATLNLFHFLARRVTHSSVVLVGAYRSSADNQQLAILLDDLHRQRPLHLTPSPLDSTDIETLLAAQWPKLPEVARPEMAEMLCSATAGNPLFLTETIRELAHTSAVPKTLPVPPSILDLIMRRLRRIPTSVRQVIESLAVLHAPGTPGLLQQISGRSEDETAAAFDIALAQGLISPHHDDRTPNSYDFHHDLIREAVNLLLSNVRRRLLHKRVAQALDPTAKAAILAYHWQQAGDAAQEVIFATQAGEAAAKTFAFDEAINYLSRAKELTPDPAQKIQLSCRIAEIHIMAANWTEAETILQAAQASLTETADSQQRQILEMQVKTQLGIIWTWKGAWQNAETTLRDALIIADENTILTEKARIQGYIGQIMTRKGLQEEALIWLSNAYETSKSAGDKFGMARNIGSKGIVYWWMEQHDQAMTCFQEALTLSTEINEIPDMSAWLGNMGMVQNSLKNFSEALSYHNQALAINRKFGIQNQTGISLSNIGNIHREMGEFSTALQFHLESLEIRHQLEDRSGLAYVLSALAEDYFCLTDYNAACLCFLQSLQIDLELENRTGVATQLEGLGRVNREVGLLDASLAAYDRALLFLASTELPSTLDACLDGKIETERLLQSGILPESTSPTKTSKLPKLPDYVTNKVVEFEPLLEQIDTWIETTIMRDGERL